MARTPEIDDFRDSLVIDDEDLESVLKEHAKLYFQVGEQAALATDRRDGLKIDLDRKEAELNDTIRAKLTKGDGRVTEAMITNKVTTNVEYQKLLRDHLKAKTAASLWNKLEEAFSQRGYVLRGLVDRSLRRMGIEDSAATAERSAGVMNSRRGEAATRRVRAQYNEDSPARKRRAS